MGTLDPRPPRFKIFSKENHIHTGKSAFVVVWMAEAGEDSSLLHHGEEVSAKETESAAAQVSMVRESGAAGEGAEPSNASVGAQDGQELMDTTEDTGPLPHELEGATVDHVDHASVGAHDGEELMDTTGDTRPLLHELEGATVDQPADGAKTDSKEQKKAKKKKRKQAKKKSKGSGANNTEEGADGMDREGGESAIDPLEQMSAAAASSMQGESSVDEAYSADDAESYTDDDDEGLDGYKKGEEQLASNNYNRTLFSNSLFFS